MARNIEIKARIENIEAVVQKATALADQGPIEIFQDDTFFICQNGRLKLRMFSPGQGELIFYIRFRVFRYASHRNRLILII